MIDDRKPHEMHSLSKLSINKNVEEMKQKTYTPQPVDTTCVELPEELELLVEEMSKNVHDVWAGTRIRQGWSMENSAMMS